MAPRPAQSTTHPDPRHGAFQSTLDLFLDRTRAVADLVAGVGSEALGRMPEPMPSAVNRMLSSLRQLVEQAPPFTAELDVLLEEVAAKRLSIQALRAELDALDHQLEILERTLSPVEAWGHSWERLQRSLVESLSVADD
jgi:hypothetical protein